MITVRKTFEKEIDFTKSIAEDIIKNGFSKDALMYANQWAEIEIWGECVKDVDEIYFGDMVRVNYGESYIYMTSGYHKMDYSLDNMGVESTRYEDILIELNGKTDDELNRLYPLSDKLLEEQYEGIKEYIPYDIRFTK